MANSQLLAILLMGKLFEK